MTPPDSPLNWREQGSQVRRTARRRKSEVLTADERGCVPKICRSRSVSTLEAKKLRLNDNEIRL